MSSLRQCIMMPHQRILSHREHLQSPSAHHVPVHIAHQATSGNMSTWSSHDPSACSRALSCSSLFCAPRFVQKQRSSMYSTYVPSCFVRLTKTRQCHPAGRRWRSTGIARARALAHLHWRTGGRCSLYASLRVQVIYACFHCVASARDSKGSVYRSMFCESNTIFLPEHHEPTACAPAERPLNASAPAAQAFLCHCLCQNASESHNASASPPANAFVSPAILCSRSPVSYQVHPADRP